MKKVLAAVVLFLAAGLGAPAAWAAPPDLGELLQKAEPGAWVRMKNPNGMETVTLATRKEGKTLTIEVHTYRKKKPQSWVEQVISIPEKKVIRARILYPDGTIDEIPVESYAIALESFENYKEVGREEIEVPAGKFSCRHYRTVIDDRLVHVWLSEEVPLTRLVKSSFKEGSIVLLEIGKGGVDPAFK